MVLPIYSEQQLSNKALSNLKSIHSQIACTHAVTDKRRKTCWINSILRFQEEQVVKVELEAKTCSSCPNYQPRNDGTDKGWCNLFNHFARACHPLTGDCINSMNEPVKNGKEPVPSTLETGSVGEITLSICQVNSGLPQIDCQELVKTTEEIAEKELALSVLKTSSVESTSFAVSCVQVNSVDASRHVEVDSLLVQSSPTRRDRSLSIEVLEQHGDKFIVRNKDNDNHYVVDPSNTQKRERCQCGDTYFRGTKCKHQIAVETYLSQLKVPASRDHSSPQQSLQSGDVFFEPIAMQGQLATYKVSSCGTLLGTINLNHIGKWEISGMKSDYGTPYEAAAALLSDPTEVGDQTSISGESQLLEFFLEKVKLDSIPSQGGASYCAWYDTQLLGTIRTSKNAEWIARPHTSDASYFCQNEEDAIYVLAVHTLTTV